jgi:hypothetical protein
MTNYARCNVNIYIDMYQLKFYRGRRTVRQPQETSR